MSDNAIRGIGLLVAAFCALLVLVVNTINDGSETVGSVAGVILVFGGIAGAVLLAVDFLRNRT